MSMPSIDLTCEKCQFKGSTRRTWGRYTYLDGRYKYPVDRELGWCYSCSDFAPIERFDADKAYDEASDCLRHINRLNNQTKFVVFKKNNKELIKHYQEKLEDAIFQQYQASRRKDTERCLTCGSDHVEPFDGDYELEYSNLQYRGSKRTGFLHPGCGGEFIATPNPVRLNVAFDERIYDVEGACLN